MFEPKTGGFSIWAFAIIAFDVAAVALTHYECCDVPRNCHSNCSLNLRDCEFGYLQCLLHRFPRNTVFVGVAAVVPGDFETAAISGTVVNAGKIGNFVVAKASFETNTVAELT